MAFYSKNARKPAPDIETTVWSCTNEECPGWMRADFSFEKEPACPMCASEMTQETRMLPEIN